MPNNPLKSIKTFLLSPPFVRNLYGLRFDTFDLVYKPEDLNEEYYNRVKQTGDPDDPKPKN